MIDLKSSKIIKIWGKPLVLFHLWSLIVAMFNHFWTARYGSEYVPSIDYINYALMSSATGIMLWVVFQRYKTVTGKMPRRLTRWCVWIYTCQVLLGLILGFVLLLLKKW